MLTRGDVREKLTREDVVDLPEEVQSYHMGWMVACPWIGIVAAVEQGGMECQRDQSCFEIDPRKDEPGSCQ
jgi:hypothetical protein